RVLLLAMMLVVLGVMVLWQLRRGDDVELRLERPPILAGADLVTEIQQQRLAAQIAASIITEAPEATPPPVQNRWEYRIDLALANSVGEEVREGRFEVQVLKKGPPGRHWILLARERGHAGRFFSGTVDE